MQTSSTKEIREGFPGQLSINLPRPLLKNMTGIASEICPSAIGYYPHAKYHKVVRDQGIHQMIIILCTAGEGWVRLNGSEHSIKKNHLTVIPPDCMHSYGSTTDPWTIHWIHAAGSHVREYWEMTRISKEKPVIPVHNAIGYKDLFEEIYLLLEKGHSAERLFQATTVLLYLLGKISHDQNEFISQEETHTNIRRVEKWMRQNLSTNLSVPELAAMANLSTSHFSAIFKTLTGFPVSEHYMRLRIQRACQLLDTTDLSIKEIARNLGFEDQLYFSRCFHRIHDISPSDYRAIKKG